MDDLCELGGRIADAKEHLQRAATIACDMLRAYPEDEGTWPALEFLADQLELMMIHLDELPGAEMAAAMRAERDYQDEMSDRADGLSY